MRTIVALLFATATIASARLGETPAQCLARYGTITDQASDLGSIIYQKGAIKVDCWFEDGKCVAIGYSLSAPGAFETLDYTQRFNDDQRARLLIANQGGSKFVIWKPDFRPPGLAETMKTEDGKRRVFITQEMVWFEDCDYIAKRRARLEPEAITEAMKGF